MHKNTRIYFHIDEKYIIFTEKNENSKFIQNPINHFCYDVDM